MFIMYWGMLSYITPPVALAAFAAASVAQTSPMRVGLEAMRLGSIIYFIPFFFVFNPAMMLQGSITDILPVVVTALIGVTLVSGALQGYLVGVGHLGRGVPGLVSRLLILIGGFMLAIPAGGPTGLSQLWMAVAALIVAAAGAGVTMWQRSASSA